MIPLNTKCKCGHGKESHAPESLQGVYGGDDYGGECCVIYRKEGKLKSCYCTKFKEVNK